MAGANATKHSGEPSQLPFPVNEEDSGADRAQEKRKKKGSSERNKHFSKFVGQKMTNQRSQKEEKRSLVLKPTRSKELISSTKAKNPWTKGKEGKNGCCAVLKMSATAGAAISLRPGQMSIKVAGKRGRKPKVVTPISPNKGTVLTASFQQI